MSAPAMKRWSMEADIWHQRTRGAATGEGVWGAAASLVTSCSKLMTAAAIAQLGECQTEDLKVPGSIPGLGMAVWSLANELRVHPALAMA